MSAPVRRCGARDRPDGLRLVAVDPPAENGFRGIHPRNDGGAACSGCGDLIAGAVWVSHRSYYCGRCAQIQLGTLARARPLSECAHCGRPIVVVARDRRVRWDVCSQQCRDARREAQRHPIYAPRVCEYENCGTTFTPRRADQRFHLTACRVAAHNEATRG